MKVNKLRQIIKEELTSVLLTEALSSSFIKKLFSNGSKWDVNALRKGFTKMGYDLNNYTDASVSKYNGTAKSLKKTSGLYVIIAKGKNDTEQAFHTGGRWGWTRNVKDGQILAMSINGQVAYTTNDGIGGKTRHGSKIGVDEKGYRSFKAIDNAFTFEIYHLDKPQEQMDAMQAKQALRQKQKFGETAFMSAKEFKNINQSKYKAILKNKAAKGLDEIPKIMQVLVKKVNAAVEEAYANPTLGQYDYLMAKWAGKDVPLKDLSWQMANMQSLFADILRDQNRAAEEAKSDWGSKYYQDQLKTLALKFKTSYKQFTSGSWIR